MKPIRASEIGSYLYCRRAWWYRRQGLEPANQAELDAGTALHRQHGRGVMLSGFLRTLALIALLTAFVLAVAYCTVRIL